MKREELVAVKRRTSLKEADHDERTFEKLVEIHLNHPLPELSSEFFWQQESSVHISEMSQKCCLYAHFEGLTGPALRDVILDEVSGDKVINALSRVFE